MTALVLGIGARARGTAKELSELIGSVLGSQGLSLTQVSMLSTLDRRSRHDALTALAEELAVPVTAFDARTLARMAVPSPSKVVLDRTGASSVAEACVLAAGAVLIVNKQSSENFTLAVGQRRESS